LRGELIKDVNKWWFKMSLIPFLVIFEAVLPEKSDFD
jgi:hypothetical protein